jgi:hypothetical protein
MPTCAVAEFTFDAKSSSNVGKDKPRSAICRLIAKLHRAAIGLALRHAAPFTASAFLHALVFTWPSSLPLSVYAMMRCAALRHRSNHGIAVSSHDPP